MIPLRDDNPTTRRPWITLGLILVNVVVYVLVQPHHRQPIVRVPQPASVIAVADDDLRFTLAFAAIPCEIFRRRPLRVTEVVATFGRADNQEACDQTPSAVPSTTASPYPSTALFPHKQVALSLLASMFLHGGWLHLLGNMWFLWIFGNNIEDRFGRFRYLAFYLASGLIATIAHIAVQPRSTVPIVGASGAIAGVMGAYLVFYPRAKVTTAFTFFFIFVKRIPAAWLLAFWFASQFVLSPGSGVAWMAHVGGFAFGAAVALLVRLFGRPPSPQFLAGRLPN